MKIASKRSIAGISAILVVLGALAVLPTASAGPRPGAGVCFADLYQPGYDECFGTAHGCGGGDGIGVGHWYYDRSGNSHTWCGPYVDPLGATDRFIETDSILLA